MHKHSHTPSVQALVAKAAELNLSDRARERLTWIVHFLTHDHSITDTCSAFGISRSTFTRWLDRFNPDDLTMLEEKSHEPLNVRQPMVPVEVVERIRTYRKASPLLGKERIAELLLAEHGIEISPSSVGRVIDRECLFFADTPLHWKKRMRSHGVPMALPEVMREVAADTPVLPDTRDDHVLLRYEVRLSWPRVKRGLIWASVMTNVAVVTMLALSAWWESKVATQSFNADLTTTEIRSSAIPRE